MLTLWLEISMCGLVMMIWLQKGHMYGSMAHHRILIGNQGNLIIIIATKIVYIFGREPRVNGMICPVQVLVEMGLPLVDIYAKQIYIEHAQPVLVEKLHY